MSIIQLNEFAQRRQQLMKNMGPGSVAIVSAAPEYLRNGDAHYSYRQNSNFYYLTGFSEPEAVLVLIPERAQGETILFNRVRDPAQELWTGRRAGQEGACKNYGADEAYPISEFVNKLPELLTGCHRVCYPFGLHELLDKQIMGVVNNLRQRQRKGVVTPLGFVNLEHLVDEMRLFKSVAEIAAMRKAAEISVQAHKSAMQICKPGMIEYELEAEILREFYRQGSRAPAYTSIVGSGENSCILHYNDNNAEIKNGDLVLIDAGCEYEYYASDITRTFPANGRFSVEQRAVYEIVLRAQLAAIAAIKPGASWDLPQEICVRIITEGLVEIGLLKGKVEDLIAQKAYFQFYMHGSGHWLGMDVHDVGSYVADGTWRKFEAGMTFTVEPGIYIAPNIPNVDKKWWNIGVRIEDDVLVTSNGCEVLSQALPKTVADIEALMAK